jgi:hypothetical protein
MPTFLNIDLASAKEPQVVEPGEYLMNIESAELKTGRESKKPYVNLRCSIEGQENAKQVYHIMSLPSADDDDEVRNSRTLAFVRLCAATGYQPGPNGIAIEELSGQQFTAILALEDDAQYGPKNIIKRFLKRD